MSAPFMIDTVQQVAIPAAGVTLPGDLVVPPEARGLVIFAHGSGSSRRSRRNRQVAQYLQAAGLATLLFDLLTEPEEVVDADTGRLRFDIALLAGRLAAVTDWTLREPSTRELGIGYFGASTGAGAALVAAALRPQHVRAVVSRGGRPDLAARYFFRVRAPTLLIVGGNDPAVLRLNRTALQQLMLREKELVIVPRATHLFEEPGALERVADLARDWFTRYLPA